MLHAPPHSKKEISMKNTSLLIALLALTACNSTPAEKCNDSAAKPNPPAPCADDFTAEPGDACDTGITEDEEGCMQGNLLMQCKDGIWTGSITHPGEEHCD